MGLLWGDGYILNNGIGGVNRVYISLVKNDMDELEKHFVKYGKWTILERKRPNRKVSKSIEINNRPLVEYLVEKGYDNKSFESQNKILNTIPDKLKVYFFRGLSDADGCFYVNKENKIYQYSIASTYEQDWTSVENLFKSIDINYKIKRREYKSGSRGSVIQVCGRKNLIKIGEYLYNYEFDNIGLSRKYEKYKQLFI